MKHVKVGVGFGLWRLGMPAAADDRARRRAGRGLGPRFVLALGPSALAARRNWTWSRRFRCSLRARRKIKLGPSVLLLNLRHPLLVAKSFATLDYLSNGRIVMAVGTGGNLADYAACGIPTEGTRQPPRRGHPGACARSGREPNSAFHGRYFNFDNVTIEPRPAPRTNNDSGTIDIWVGGKSEAALKRTARLADGYFASFLTPEEFARKMATIRGYAAEYGRANARIESGLILLCRLRPRDRARAELEPVVRSLDRGGEEFFQRTVFGSPDDIIARLKEYIDVGLDKFVLWPVAEPAAWSEQMELIGREIATHYNRAAQAA